jgi:phage gp29-like protein
MVDSSLLDQWGKKIPLAEIAALTEEISPVGGEHARPPFQGNIAFGINPQHLGTILRAADTGSSLDWFILAEEIEELFTHYATVMGKRKRQVSQLAISVKSVDDKNAAYKKHAKFVEDWLDTGTLQTALFDICDAIAKGFSVCEIVWESAPGRVRPRELIYRPQRFFEFDWHDGKTILLRSEEGLIPLVPHKFLQHLHPSKSGNPVRSGVTRMVAFIWCYATFTMKDWALFVQAYGLPIRLGKYGPSASDGDKRTLWRAVKSIAGDVAAIIPDSMQMEFVTAADRAAGAALYERRMDWLNMEVSKLVLGSTAGTDAISGSHAIGKVHQKTEDDVEKFDAFLLNQTINRQLVAPMIAFTFGAQDAYPLITIGRPDEVPIKDVIAAVADLGNMGLKVKAAEIRARLQLEDPEDGDEVIGGVPPAPVVKPDIPSLAVTPPDDAEGQSQRPGWLFNLISRHTQETPDDVVEALTARLAEDAAGAMHGLTERVRTVMMGAKDLHDLSAKLDDLKLPRAEFALAMTRGMVLANLAGQVSLVEELRGRK